MERRGVKENKKEIEETKKKKEIKTGIEKKDNEK